MSKFIFKIFVDYFCNYLIQYFFDLLCTDFFFSCHEQNKDKTIKNSKKRQINNQRTVEKRKMRFRIQIMDRNKIDARKNQKGRGGGRISVRFQSFFFLRFLSFIRYSFRFSFSSLHNGKG